MLVLHHALGQRVVDPRGRLRVGVKKTRDATFLCLSKEGRGDNTRVCVVLCWAKQRRCEGGHGGHVVEREKGSKGGQRRMDESRASMQPTRRVRLG